MYQLLATIQQCKLHLAETKQKSHWYRNRTDMTSLKNEVISVINNVSNILATDSIHGSRNINP